MSGQRLIDRIVHCFEHHVVQTAAVIGVANIHARALPDCFQPFEYFDIGRVVFAHLFLSLAQKREI